MSKSKNEIKIKKQTFEIINLFYNVAGANYKL